MYRVIHVYDLDGVLVDSSHRYRNKADGSIDLDYWIANRHKVADDKLLPLAKKYRRDVADPSVYVIVCTARQWTAADVNFISTRLGMPDKLIMRPKRDMTHDAQLKRRQLSRLFNLRQFAHLPRFFWDDNKKNLDACAHLFTRVFHIPSRITAND